MKTINTLTMLMFVTSVWVGNVGAEFQGAQNTFYGVNAGINTAGDDDVNTFIGADAGFTNTTGAFNTFLGADVGYLKVHTTPPSVPLLVFTTLQDHTTAFWGVPLVTSIPGRTILSLAVKLASTIRTDTITVFSARLQVIATPLGRTTSSWDLELAWQTLQATLTSSSALTLVITIPQGRIISSWELALAILTPTKANSFSSGIKLATTTRTEPNSRFLGIKLATKILAGSTTRSSALRRATTIQ